MALTDAKAKNSKPAAKQQKLTDGEGMYLLVTPAGGKCWRMKYRFGGKEKVLALGTYPEVSLSDARDKRGEARKLLAKGIDPGVEKKAKRFAVVKAAKNTFEIIAKEWYEKFNKDWSEDHQKRQLSRLEHYVFPSIGQRPVTEIEATEILVILQKVEKRSAEVAHRVKGMCAQIFRYAIATGRAKHNPVPDLQGALAKVENSHFAAPTDPKKLAPLLRAMDGYEGSFQVQAALKLAPMVFLRPAELRSAEWSEIDLEAAEWNIPAEKMKMDRPHLVPLCTQVLQIFKELQPLTGNGRYVFPSIRTNARCMSENTINAALRSLGFGRDEITGHGFRATARTILDEVLGFRPDIIEHQLAHEVKDPNGRAYNRTSHLPYRRHMMQAWADYLDALKNGEVQVRASAEEYATMNRHSEEG